MTRLFGRPLVVLLGEDDTRRSSNLRKNAAADRQDANRFERGQSYFAAARREAERRGAAFNWRLRTVPNVGHSNAGMAGPAASLIAAANGKRP